MTKWNLIIDVAKCEDCNKEAVDYTIYEDVGLCDECAKLHRQSLNKCAKSTVDAIIRAASVMKQNN